MLSLLCLNQFILFCYLKIYFRLDFIDFYRDCGSLSEVQIFWLFPQILYLGFKQQVTVLLQFLYVYKSLQACFPRKNEDSSYLPITPLIYQAGIFCGSNICSPHPCFSTLNNKSLFYKTRSCISIKQQKNTYAVFHRITTATAHAREIHKQVVSFCILQNFLLCHCRYLQSFNHHNASFPFLTRLPYAQLNIQNHNNQKITQLLFPISYTFLVFLLLMLRWCLSRHNL